jgi:hypothetical protein
MTCSLTQDGLQHFTWHVYYDYANHRLRINLYGVFQKWRHTILDYFLYPSPLTLTYALKHYGLSTAVPISVIPPSPKIVTLFMDDPKIEKAYKSKCRLIQCHLNQFIIWLSIVSLANLVDAMLILNLTFKLICQSLIY